MTSYEVRVCPQHTHTNLSYFHFTCQLYENGKVPLGHIPTAKLSDKLEAGERPPRPSSHHVPDYVWKEMETCWSLNIIDRPSFSEITLVLGIFQNPELETLQEIRHALGEQQTFLHSLIKYPGFLERLVQILMCVVFACLSSESGANLCLQGGVTCRADRISDD